MSLNHSPSIVLSDLELNLDFKNTKLFSNTLGTNLVPNYYYDPSTWGNTFQKQVTTGIDAPDGSKNAVRITPRVYSGTYTITSNVATIKISDHQLNNSSIYLDFTSGGGVDGLYTIIKVDDDTFTANVTAANTSGNVTAYSRTGLRVTFSAFTPNGTDRYTVGFWVRLVEGTFNTGQVASMDFSDGAPSLTYTSQLVQGKWVYVTSSGVPTATAKSFMDLASDYFGTAVLDFWGLKIENQTADNAPMPVKDSIGGYTFNNYRPEFSKFEDGFITFDRSTTANTAMTISSIAATGTTTVTATVPSTTGWTQFDAFSITGATGTEQSKLNGVWVINSVLSPTTFNFVLSSAMTTGTYTTNLGTATKSSKWGTHFNTTASGNLAVSNFMYNNHTWEVWFRINDRTPSSLDTTEGYSVLACYAGWHSGFLYTSSSMIYAIKDGAALQPTACSWTVGASGAQINQGSWYQIAVVRNGSTFTPYLNGVQLGTGSTITPSSVNIGVTNNLAIGAAGYYSKPGQSRYMYYSKNSIALMRMYSRALTASQIAQNFNSSRGRFGL